MLAGRPEAAAEARAALRDLTRVVSDEVFSDFALLVNELVTNSIRHADLGDEGWIRVRAEISGSSIRAEVSDSGRGFAPVVHTPGPSQIGGRGLFLLDELADRWGVSQDGAFRAWFEIDLPTAS